MVISASYIFRLAIHLHRLKGLIPSCTLNDTIEMSHKEYIRCACHTCVCTVYNEEVDLLSDASKKARKIVSTVKRIVKLSSQRKDGLIIMSSVSGICTILKWS